MASQYPTAAKALGAVTAGAGAIGSAMGLSGEESTPLSPEDQARYDQTQAAMAEVNSPMNTGKNPRYKQPDFNPKGVGPRSQAAQMLQYEKANDTQDSSVARAFTDTDVPESDVSSFINQKLAASDAKAAAGEGDTTQKDIKDVAQSRLDRIKNLRGDYQGLYRELLGGDSEDAKMNALLLLSNAGFKFAGSKAPTAAMALSEAGSDVVKGFASIVAQQRERQLKVDTAALSQAITDVDSQDKYAQAVKLQMLKGDYELIKEEYKNGGTKLEDAGLGGRNAISRRTGSFEKFGIDPNDPAVTSAITSPYTLNPTDNPFVRNMGQAPTAVVTDKESRLKLGQALSAIDNNLNTIGQMKNTVANAYSPGTWVSNKVNNIFVPVSGGLLKPNFNTADAATKLRSGFTSVAKGSAAAQDTGRVAVQQQEWEQNNLAALQDPTAFFSNPEIAAITLNSLEATQRNARQSILTQLGYEKNNYVMDTPNIGTKNDPFVIPTDKDSQQSMFTFLGSTIGKTTNPNALIYLKMPNGNVNAFKPAQLQGLMGTK